MGISKEIWDTQKKSGEIWDTHLSDKGKSGTPANLQIWDTHLFDKDVAGIVRPWRLAPASTARPDINA
ncbi:hypothetical protein, partial [Aeromonas australiensis]|uniref:hypothetical protein n=1 Tax=Aeromonas australiensis TaxID=1114880 RepID=UPI001ADEC79E